MASQAGHDKSTTRLPPASYLFTPPENTADSFSHQEHGDEQDRSIQDWRKTAQPALLPPIVHTPPASPKTDHLPSISSATGYGAQDTPLFPDQTPRERAQSQQPLFERERTPSPSPCVRPPPTASVATQPQERLYFPHNLGITTGDQALRYYLDRMAEHRLMRGIELPRPQKSPTWNLHKEDVRQLQSLTRSAGISKPRSTPRIQPKAKAAAAASPVKTLPPKRRTPKARTHDDFVDSASPQREPATKHKRAPPSKKIEGENVSWTELPDYAPPASDLDTNPKSLKVTWHGHALPMLDDIDQDHLHAQELQVASTLRLSCAIYLTNKRKIFQARLQALKDGKNFTKTAAQSACKIDVNKASQLWEAFDRVGWFEPKWYKQYL